MVGFFEFIPTAQYLMIQWFSLAADVAGVVIAVRPSRGLSEGRYAKRSELFHSSSPPSACPPGLHGPLCQLQCDCANGASCHPASGQCLCPPGLRGARCHRGQSDQRSLLRHDGRVAVAWPRLTERLIPPSFPPSLPLFFLPPLAECEQGTYGPGCSRTCDCDDEAACDPVTGRCLCSSGKTGVRCDVGEISCLDAGFQSHDSEESTFPTQWLCLNEGLGCSVPRCLILTQAFLDALAPPPR